MKIKLSDNVKNVISVAGVVVILSICLCITANMDAESIEPHKETKKVTNTTTITYLEPATITTPTATQVTTTVPKEIVATSTTTATSSIVTESPVIEEETQQIIESESNEDIKIYDEVSYEVPKIDNFYGYMDYRCITNTDSAQYKFQQNCWTDSQGLRRQGDDYVVALGSFYSINIGDRFYITLDTGITYTVVLGDCKADCHTNSTNQYTPAGDMINIIEFIVDIPCLDYTVAQSGNIGTYNNLSGNVVSITKIN